MIYTEINRGDIFEEIETDYYEICKLSDDPQVIAALLRAAAETKIAYATIEASQNIDRTLDELADILDNNLKYLANIDSYEVANNLEEGLNKLAEAIKSTK